MDARLNGVYLPGLWIGFLQYGAPVSVTLSPESSVWRNGAPSALATAIRATRPLGDYWVHFPLQGQITASVNGDRLVCDESCGVVAAPIDPHVLCATSNTVRLSLEIRGEALHRQLAALLGDAVDGPILFDPLLRLDAGHGRSLAGFLRFAVSEIDRVGLRWSTLLATQFEQFMMSGLLLSQPHNYSDRLRLRERPIASRDVHRAIEYIHENIAEPISLADLVAVSGVAGRTLMKHFRDFKGVSPMRYIRNLRLERVHDELANGRAQQVLETAVRWGFTHAGRFSVDYRKRFGESPSATLERRRGH